MRIVKNKLEKELNIRTQKNYPIAGVEFIDMTPLLIQKEVFQEITDCFYKELQDKQIDYILAPEARGFLFAASVAVKLGVGLIPIRKKGKLPPNVVESQIEYEKEYGTDILEFPQLVKETYQGKRLYILDDIYATGNTIKAIEKEIEKLGGVLIGKGVVLNIVNLNKEKHLFSLLEVEEEE